MSKTQKNSKNNPMEVINSHIASESFSKLYLLGGDEDYLVNQYADKLIGAIINEDDSLNMSVFKSDKTDPNEIISIASTMPFFSERRVIRIEDSGYFKKGNEDIENFLNDIPDYCVVVFIEKNIDKRGRLYKLADKIGTVALFDTPDTRTLFIWIKGLFKEAGVSIDESAIFHLVETVGINMNSLANETNKLISYALESGHVTNEDVNILCSDQVENKIFDMTEALSKGDKATTIKLYDDLLQLREPAMRILFLITRQFHLLAKAKFAINEGADVASTASSLKLAPFIVKKYMNICNEYDYSELLKCVALCQDADTSIKTGAARDTIAVELLILKLLNIKSM